MSMKILEVKIDDNKNVLVDSDFKKVDSDMISHALLFFMQKTAEDIYHNIREDIPLLNCSMQRSTLCRTITR